MIFNQPQSVNTSPLLLASASPRRKELLSRLNIPFDVLVAPVTEHEDPAADPRAMVLHNAALKAAWACAQRPGALVLAADTTVALAGRVLNKPADLADARAMLRHLSGRTHTVFTGVCLWRRVGTPLRGVRPAPPASTAHEYDPKITHCETSSVTFRAFDDATITRYFQIVNPLDKAGAYGIQEGRELILQKYSGSLANIMGLPLEWLAAQLHALALIPAPAAPIIADSRYHDDARPAADSPAAPA